MNTETRSEIVSAVVESIGLHGSIKYAAVCFADVRFPKSSVMVIVGNGRLDLQPGEAVTIEIRRSL